MEIFVALMTLFAIGSVLGYIIEVFFRRIFTAKKWVNPGFMVGPYLPIYGFGTMILYIVWYIDIPAFNNLHLAAQFFIRLGLIGVAMTLLELVGGLIFLKFFNMRLWDYRDRWANFKGVICPLFSLIWMVVGGLFYLVLYYGLGKVILWLDDYPYYVFFIGLVIGMMCIDAAYSLRLGFRVRTAFKGMKVRYDTYREELKEKVRKEGSEKKSAFLVLHSTNKEELKKFARSFHDKIEESKEKIKWKKKHH